MTLTYMYNVIFIFRFSAFSMKPLSNIIRMVVEEYIYTSHITHEFEMSHMGMRHVTHINDHFFWRLVRYLLARAAPLVPTHTYTHTHIPTCTYTHPKGRQKVHSCTHAHTHMNTLTHTHTPTHTHLSLSLTLNDLFFGVSCDSPLLEQLLLCLLTYLLMLT